MKQQYHLLRLVVFTAMVVALVLAQNSLVLAANQPKGSEPVSSSGKKANKMVALTFDDGPDKIYTDKVLDILKDYKVKGTFFVIGEKVKQYPGVIKRIAQEGHALGNHSWSHSQLTKINKEKIRQEIVKTDTAIREITGFTPTLVRPPYGATSAQIKEEIHALGHTQALWNVDTRDWATSSSVASILKTVKSSSGNKITVLMHSGGGKRDKTLKALPQIIDYYRSQGYTFVTMSELNGVADNIEGSTASTGDKDASKPDSSGDKPQSNDTGGTIERNIRLIYNGSEVNFPDAKPFIDENSRVQVPVRFMAETLKFDVKWGASSGQKSIILTKDNLSVDLKIGDKAAVVNGSQIDMDTSAMLFHERTYVPLRFLSELAGMDITWSSAGDTIKLSYKETKEDNSDEQAQTQPTQPTQPAPPTQLAQPGDTYIVSAPRATVQQAKAWATAKGATDVFIDLADIVWDEATQVGVDPTVVYCQFAKETGFGKFGGILDETFMNPAGLKTPIGGSDTDHEAHQRFTSWEEGVQAQIDHLALYAGAPGYPKTFTPDPRHFPGLMGQAATVEALGGTWAISPTYGVEIVNMMMELEATSS
ncbi:polysaccharide deacetylase family protein [Paenibacillus jiagnxiensis]|uniref:polysaccharide deacetylase family protein n=1 Tax=Paenibacillus jiagnxiensis TaxID=3228926 RepID=UPI0033B2011D